MFKRFCTCFGLICIAWLPFKALAEVSWVLNPAGKAGRGIVEVIGDPNTGRWTTPAIDHEKHIALSVEKAYNPDEHVVETQIVYNGDNCNEDGSLCLALHYFKSTRGDMNYEDYDQLVFEIEVIESPTEDVLLRIGSYPTRAELSIKDKLPDAGAGWKTITITKAEFTEHIFEGFTFDRVADPFSISTVGKLIYKLKRIRWEKT